MAGWRREGQVWVRNTRPGDVIVVVGVCALLWRLMGQLGHSACCCCVACYGRLWELWMMMEQLGEHAAAGLHCCWLALLGDATRRWPVLVDAARMGVRVVMNGVAFVPGALLLGMEPTVAARLALVCRTVVHSQLAAA